MNCSCKSKNSVLSPLFYHTIGDGQKAVFIQIKPSGACQVPYWCKPGSAYDNAPPTGYIPLTGIDPNQPYPVSAKYTVGLIDQDQQNGINRNPGYYGVVVYLGNRVIRFNPKIMTGSVTIMPKQDFITKYGQGATQTNNPPATATGSAATGSGTSNTDNGSPAPGNALDAATQTVEQHPLAVAGGLLLLLFGVATLASLKK